MASGFGKATRVRKIKIDSNIKLSKTMEDVSTKITPIVTIYDTFDKKLSYNIPVFPTDYALAKLSLLAYSDSDPSQQDLPSGWEFLTAASNNHWNNGYYGCAYFNEKQQQIAIAHRGTKISNLNDLYTDGRGVYKSEFFAQMSSAATFTELILNLISEFNRNGAYLKLSFTGYSLGGWLAQVTTFTAKYLSIDERKSQFSLIRETQKGYHAHTVVFESPGCKQLLEKLKTEYINYCHGDVNSTQISIDSLDITTYLSAPNRINCCNAHVGQLYRLSVNLLCTDSYENANRRRVTKWAVRAAKSVGNFGRRRFKYTIATHGLNKIIECFDPQTGQVKRDSEGILEVQEVLNWPIIEGIVSHGIEYDEVIKWLSGFKNFDLSVDETFSDKHEIHYHTKNVDENGFKFNVFNDIELNFVGGYDIRRFFPEYESVIFSVDTDDYKNLLKSVIEKLDSMKFEIDTDKHLSLLDSKFQPLEFISYVKQLNHFFPKLNCVKPTTKCFNVDLLTAIYKTESDKYLSPNNVKSFEIDVGSFNLCPFLIKENPQILLQVEKVTSCAAIETYKSFELVKAVTKFGKGNSIFLDVKTILRLKQLSFASIVEHIRGDYLFVIEVNENSEAAVKLVMEIIQKAKGNNKVKIILIIDSESETQLAGIIGQDEPRDHEGIQLSDLSSDTRKQILNRELINLQGSRVSLAQIIPQVEALKSVKDLIQLASDINCKLDVGSDYLRNSRFDVFAVSNISLEDFQSKFGHGEQVSSYVGWDPNMARFVILDDNIQFKGISWCFLHKFRIHWLYLEEDQLILKDSKSHFDGNNDKFIERFFTEKLETQVQEVFSGCFVLRDACDINEFVKLLCNEELWTLVGEIFLDYAEKRDVSDIVKIFTEKLNSLVNEVLSGCFVLENKNNDCKLELLKRLLSEKLETVVHKVFSSCFDKRLEGHCEYTQALFVERFRTQVHEMLSGHFVTGEDDMFISSSGKCLLESLLSTEVLVRLGSQEEIKTGSELPKLGEVEDYYIGRSLTTKGKRISKRTLLYNKDEIFAIGNTDVNEFLRDVKILPHDLVMHYEEWVHGQNVGKIKFIVLNSMKIENQFQSICEICPNKNIHLLIRIVHLHSAECYCHTRDDSNFNNDPDDNPDDDYDDYGSNFSGFSDCPNLLSYIFLVPYKFKHKKSRMCSSEKNIFDVDRDVVYREDAEVQINERYLSIDDIRDKIVNVKGEPMMGKATFFIHLALHKKQLFPSLWVVVIKLNEISWEDMQDIEVTDKTNSVIEFFAKILKLESEFEKSLFEYCWFDEKVVLILVGFREVIPKYNDQIFGLLESLQTEMKVKQLWLSSALIDRQPMGTVYTLRRFIQEDQNKFLLKCWSKQLGINLIEDRSYLETLISLLPFGNAFENWGSVAEFPIMLMLLVKLSQENFKKFYNGEIDKFISIRLIRFDIHNLYKESIDKIVSLHFSTRCGFDSVKQNTQAFDIANNRYVKETMKKYKLLALVSCGLGSLITANQRIEELIKDIGSGEEFLGIIRGVENGVPQFIHSTFAEYFAALWLFEEMVATEDDERSKGLCSGLFKLLDRERADLSLLNNQLGSDHIIKEKLTTYLQGHIDHLKLLSKIPDNDYHNVVKLIIDAGIVQNSMETYKACRTLLKTEVVMETTDRFEEICLDMYGDACDFTKIITENHLLHRAAETNASGKMTSFLLSKVTKESLHIVVNHFKESWSYSGTITKTALHVAAENNRLEVAKVLLENGADVDLKNSDGYTALDWALGLRHCEMVELLLNNWVIKLPLDLIRSCEFIEDENVAEIFIKYIEKCFKQSDAAGSTNNSLITSVARYGDKPIRRASSDRPIEHFSNVVKGQVNEKPIVALIDNIACEYPDYLSQLFLSEITDGNTLLHMAARLNYMATAQLIFGLGADADVRNENGETALSVAAKHIRLAFVLWSLFRTYEVIDEVKNFIHSKIEEQTIDLFLEIVVKNIPESDLITKRFDGGDTMLHVAAQLDLVKLAKIIIDRGADVNVRNDDNHTPLSLACKSGHLHMTELLIKRGAIVKDDQQSPLLWAIYGCFEEIVKIVIENGADVNINCRFACAINKCFSSWTPLQLILDLSGQLYGEHCEYLAKILIMNGADLSACLQNFTFHFNKYSTNLIVLLVICGLDIYATNNEGVSIVTYLEEHWKSMDYNDQRILLSVCLFSNYSLPRYMDVSTDFESALKFGKYVKDELPEFYNLINACKEKDMRQIRHHLNNLVSANKFDYDETYESYMTDCGTFIEISISLIIREYITTRYSLSFYNLATFSGVCDKYFAELES